MAILMYVAFLIVLILILVAILGDNPSGPPMN